MSDFDSLDPLFPVIRRTYLSHRPHPHSRYIALLSVLLLLGASMAYWEAPDPRQFPLVASAERVFNDNRPWLLLSTIVVHSDLSHFLGNAITFGFWSFLLFGYFGRTVYPALAWAGGVATNGIALLTYPPNVTLVGASGMVYWMAGFWLVLYVGIDRRVSIPQRLLRCMGFAFITLLPQTYRPEVSYRTHAIGFVLGVAMGAVYFFLYRKKFRKAEEISWE